MKRMAREGKSVKKGYDGDAVRVNAGVLSTELVWKRS